MHRYAILLTLLVAAVSWSCSGPTIPLPEEGTIVRFAFTRSPEDTIRVLVRRAETISRAREVLDGRSTANILGGIIVRGAGVDPQYPWHFDPDRVVLGEAIIGCVGGTTMRTEQEVEDFFAAKPSGKYCEAVTPVAVEPR
jgi:hypothetical protein